MTMVDRPSPNFNRRKLDVRCIVLHADASPSEEATLSWISSPVSKVSYHYLVGRDGTVYRCVSEGERAWAVGVSEWRGVTDVNSCSISIAFANRQDGDELLTPAQMEAVRELVKDIKSRLPIEEVTTHKIVARPVGRKHDPETAPNFKLGDFTA